MRPGRVGDPPQYFHCAVNDLFYSLYHVRLEGRDYVCAYLHLQCLIYTYLVKVTKTTPTTHLME